MRHLRDTGQHARAKVADPRVGVAEACPLEHQVGFIHSDQAHAMLRVQRRQLGAHLLVLVEFLGGYVHEAVRAAQRVLLRRGVLRHVP